MSVNQTICHIESMLGFRNISALGTRYFYKNTSEGRIFLVRTVDEYLVCPLPQILAACIAVNAGAPTFYVEDFICYVFDLISVSSRWQPTFRVCIYNHLWENCFYIAFEDSILRDKTDNRMGVTLCSTNIPYSVLDKLEQSLDLRKIFGFKH